MKFLAQALLLASLATIPALAATDDLVSNGGFEAGNAGWGLYVPDESKDKNCRFDVVGDGPHSGTNCLRMQSDDYARFCVGSSLVPVQPGEHYRISVWYKAGPDAHVREKAPGFAVRLFLAQNNADAAGGHLFIAPGNRVTRNTPADPAAADLPTTWTQLDAVIEIPPGVDAVGPSLFSWWSKGTIYADDFSIEKVDASVPVTPLWQKPADSSAPTATAADASPVTVSDEELLAALNLDAPGMEKVKAAAQADPKNVDWKAVQSAYLDYRRNACPARWSFKPSDKPTHPTLKDDAVADGILRHQIPNTLHFPMPAVVDMGKDFNWEYDPVPRDSPAFSEEWTFGPIGRMDFWNTLGSAYWQTGDEKYAAGWVDQLKDFAAKNPVRYAAVPGVASLWRPLDSAIRISIAWPNAYFHFLSSPSFTPEANWLYYKLNYQHAQLLLHDLKDGTRHGNWATTECGGLYIVGTLYPECRDASSWRDYAIERLTSELDIIVPPDGFEAEYTPTYHFVALDGFRRPLDMAKLNNLQVPDIFRTKILGMYRAAVEVMDQSGNDVATNDSKVLSASLEAAAGLKLGDDPLLAWAASHGQKGQQPPDSSALPYAGFYAMRGGWKRDDAFLFFRAGPTGIGHQHEDMLEVVMRAWNKTLLFDPGQYPYDNSDWRRFTLGTASHNTIIVDGKWQHRGPTKPPVSKPTGNPWVTTPLFDYVAGTYDAGYQLSIHRARPFDPQTWKGKPDTSVSHTRRVVFLRPYYALVVDTLDGTGTHTFDAHFHLDAPAARLDPATQSAFSQNVSGAQLGLYPLERENLAVDIVQGQMTPLLGWMPIEHRPIPTIRFRKQQAAPAIFATFLYPYLDHAPTFVATPLTTTGDGIWSRTLKTSHETAEIVLVKKGAAEPITVTSSLLGDISTNASGLILRQPAGSKVTYAGGMDLTSFSDGQVEITLDKPASLIFCHEKDHLLCFNPGDESITLTVKKPFASTATLPPQAWTTVTGSGASPASAPIIFQPLEASSSTVGYSSYLKTFPDSPADPAATPIKIAAESLTVPAGAVLAGKIGADGKVLGRWDQTGTVATAHVDVPKSGWYRLKVRYCSADMPMRSLLIDGKIPFTEAEDFSLPATVGESPSDGWSNISSDWHELVLGAEQAAPGWKIYLKKGPCVLDLRNDGGGLNLDWLELDPS